SRMVNLTTLAPDMVGAILDETLPPGVTLFDLAVDPPALWEDQRRRLSGGAVHKQRTSDMLLSTEAGASVKTRVANEIGRR
ncbi:MAG: hypothetical protein WA970_19580, partial [Gammaproteobacteria bacterium]